MLVGARKFRVGRREGAVGVAVVAVAALVLAVPPAPQFQAPVGVTAQQLEAAVLAWITECAQETTGHPAGCPMGWYDTTGGDRPYIWSAGQGFSSLQIVWSSDAGLFVASGRLDIRYRHNRAEGDGRITTYAGTFRGPFSAGLRPEGTDASYSRRSLAGRPSHDVNGFTVVVIHAWTLPCCPRAQAVG
jgi:hypothetical protein